jgi:hypothetical protein
MIECKLFLFASSKQFHSEWKQSSLLAAKRVVGDHARHGHDMDAKHDRGTYTPGGNSLALLPVSVKALRPALVAAGTF